MSAPGGCLLRGMSAPGRGGGVSSQGGVCSGGCVCSGGGIPACTEANAPLLWTESQTPVKTLPYPNFVAAGNKTICKSHKRFPCDRNGIGLALDLTFDCLE